MCRLAESRMDGCAKSHLILRNFDIFSFFWKELKEEMILMIAMDIYKKALKPAAMLLLASVALVSFAQSGAGSQLKVHQGKGQLKATKGKVAPAGVVRPRNFFPKVSEALTPKQVKPENPSRTVPIPGYEDKPVRNNFQQVNITGGNNSFFAPARTLPTVGGGSKFTKSAGNPLGKFPGIGQTFATPPDTSAAAGPEYIVEVVNVAIAFFRKSDGVKVFQQTFDSNGFLAGTGVGPTPFSFDPRVCFDKKTGRFYAMTLDVDFTNETSSVILCVSSTSDPNDPWNIYRLDNTQVDGSGEAYWGDYPQIGFSNDYIVVSTNLFAFDAGTNPPSTLFQVVDLNPVLVGAPATQTIFDDPDRFNARPVRNNQNAPSAAFAVNYSGSIGGGQGLYRIYGWEKVGTDPVGSFADVVTAGTATGGVGGAPSAGYTLDTISLRMMDGSFSNNRIAVAHTQRGQTNARAAVVWLEFDMNDFPSGAVLPDLRQNGEISLGGTFHAFQPAIELNANGDISVIFTRSSATTTADVMVAVRQKNDPLGTIGTPFEVASSPDFTAPFNFNSRWGDYASVTVDPLDDGIFWGCNEVAVDPNTWGTVIVKWEVSQGNSGTNIGPLSVTPVLGTNTGGNAASFADTDSNEYVMSSEFVAGRGGYAAYELTFQSPDVKANVDTIELAVETLASINTPGYFYILNVDTGQWELRDTTRVKTTLTTSGFRISQGGSAYVDNSGFIKCRVMAFQSFRKLGGALLSFDFRSDKAVLNINKPN